CAFRDKENGNWLEGDFVYTEESCDGGFIISEGLYVLELAKFDKDSPFWYIAKVHLTSHEKIEQAIKLGKINYVSDYLAVAQIAQDSVLHAGGSISDAIAAFNAIAFEHISNSRTIVLEEILDSFNRIPDVLDGYTVRNASFDSFTTPDLVKYLSRSGMFFFNSKYSAAIITDFFVGSNYYNVPNFGTCVVLFLPPPYNESYKEPYYAVMSVYKSNSGYLEQRSFKKTEVLDEGCYLFQVNSSGVISKVYYAPMESDEYKVFTSKCKKLPDPDWWNSITIH
ncbi:MAG: hypothetical protein LBU51_10955, partial [Bacteroidales bacterium]|nr:hypothetical protein [Bacteroidales bacterium]